VQLDQNRIVIRERVFVDVLDLALRVIRQDAWPLAVALVAGVVPVMCLNAWLLADVAQEVEEIPLGSGIVIEVPFGYMWCTLLLVIWETPLATAPITLVLGQVLFAERPRAGQAAADYFKSLPQMFWYQVVLRAVFVPWVVTWPVLFGGWPYLNEVILLERNPMRRGRRNRMTTYRRAAILHGRNVAELFVRWMGSVALGVLLFFSLWLSIWITGGMLLNEWAWGGPVYTVCFPLALWLVVGYFAVVRFLGYLDLRIRREGWEVELMLRAEGARLTRQLT